MMFRRTLLGALIDGDELRCVLLIPRAFLLHILDALFLVFGCLCIFSLRIFCRDLVATTSDFSLPIDRVVPFSSYSRVGRLTSYYS
jgi:hypothetical protein